MPGIFVPERQQHEDYVGSSFQFQARGMGAARIPAFIRECGDRGVEIKWFGADEPVAFTSRYDSWQYLSNHQELPNTREILSTTCDMRVPLTFSLSDCADIVEIVGGIVVSSNG